MRKPLQLLLFASMWMFCFTDSNAQLVVNEIHADPASGSAGDANKDGTRSTSEDEFVEIYNIGNSAVNISGWRLRDNAVSNRHTFPSGTVLPAGGTIVVFGGGNPQGSFGGSLVQTATSGALGLNNGGDRVSLLNGSGSTVNSYQYSRNQGGDNQSITRSPDGTGSFQKHFSVSNLRYSAGTTRTGGTFSGNSGSGGGAGCNATVSNFPYSESFEGGFGSWSQSTADDINFTRRSGNTPSSGTGPSSANAGSFYAYVEASGNGTGYPNKTATLTSPCFNLSSLSQPTLTFDYHMFGTSVNNLRVEVSTNGGSSWTQIFTRSGSQGNSWRSQSINLTSYKGSSTAVRFTVTTGSGTSGWSSDIAIDNIALRNGSTGGGNGDNGPLHVVTWNIEWFGNPSSGPSPESTQKARVKGIIQTLDADVYALQEIANESLMTELVNELPEYSWVFSTFVSGGNNTPGSSQKLGFIYKTSRVNRIASQALLTNLHPLYNGGNNSFVSDFPTGSPSQFWASGRMPYMLTADVTIGGTTQRVYFIDIHAKASGGTTNQNRRRYDAQKLKDYIDSNLGNRNVILLGDYNDQMDFSNSPYNIYFNDNASNPGSDGEYYNALTRQLDINGENTFVTSSSFLDHITITDELVDNYTSGSVKVHDEVVTSDFTSRTSDHIPVSAKFRFGNSTATRVASAPILESKVIEETSDMEITIFPNPTSGNVNIRVIEDENNTPALLSIYDLTGTKLLQKNLLPGEHQIDVSKIGANGVYLFQLTQKDNISIQRIILNK